MIVYNPEGTAVLSIKVDDSSDRYEEIMGTSIVYLATESPTRLRISPSSAGQVAPVTSSTL